MQTRSLRGFHLLLALWLLQSFAYFIPAATWSPVSRMGLTAALVERGQLSVGSFAQLTGDRAYRDGRWYSDKAPVPSVLAAPAYALVRFIQERAGRAPAAARPTRVIDGEPRELAVNRSFRQLLYISSVATSGLGGAVVGVLLFELVRRRFGEPAALFASVSTVLGTPLLPYSTSLFGHVPAAAFLLGGALLLDRPDTRAGRHALAGACLALAVGCEYLTALPAAVLAGSVLARDRAPRTLLALCAGAAAPAALLLGYHAACFGSPFRTAYAFVTNETFRKGHAQGLMGLGLPTPDALAGLLWGGERGLFWLAPITLLAVIGLIGHLRAAPRDATARGLALGLLALLLANAGYYMWWGGAATGPRHLVPALPVLGLGVGFLCGRRALRPLLAIAALLSIFNMLAFTAVGLEAPPKQETLIGYAYEHLRHGRIALLPGATNLAIELGFAAAASLGPLLCWWLLGARALWRRLARVEGA